MSDELVDLLERAARLRQRRDELRASSRAKRRSVPLLAVMGGTSVLAVILAAVASIGPSPEPLDAHDAVVTEVSGAAPVRVGEPCTVQRAVTSFPYERTFTQVDCGGLRLFGHRASGAVACTEDRGACEDLAPTEQDGDPALRIDLPTRTVTVHDEAWRAKLSLEAH